MPNYGTIVQTGGAGNLYATNELPVDMHPKTMSALVSLTPLTSILTKLRTDKAHNFRIDHQEKKEIATTIVCAQTESSAPSGANALAIQGDGYSLVLDTLIFNPRTF